MHFLIISAESNNITDRKLYVGRISKGKGTFFRNYRLFTFWQQVEVVEK